MFGNLNLFKPTSSHNLYKERYVNQNDKQNKNINMQDDKDIKKAEEENINKFDKEKEFIEILNKLIFDFKLEPEEKTPKNLDEFLIKINEGNFYDILNERIKEKNRRN